MTKTYTLKQYKKKNEIVINPRTKKEYGDLTRFFDSKNITYHDKQKATTKDYFNSCKDICFSFNLFGNGYIRYSPLSYYKAHCYKIITPNQLKEYNKFMEKEDKIFKCGFKAIAWLKENPDREILYTEQGYSKNRLKYDLEYKNFKKRSVNIYTEEPFRDWYCLETLWVNMSDILNWREIKVISVNKPKEKTLKEKLEAKEDFKHKDKAYRFNKKGVLMNSDAEPLSLYEIQEFLKKIGEK